jgi:hypothetical protein
VSAGILEDEGHIRAEFHGRDLSMEAIGLKERNVCR